MSDPDCHECREEKCRCWCPVHLEHHVVATLVTACLEKATAPPISQRRSA